MAAETGNSLTGSRSGKPRPDAGIGDGRLALPVPHRFLILTGDTKWLNMDAAAAITR
jgi:hypothetical protein